MSDNEKHDPTGVTVHTTNLGRVNYPTATGFYVDIDGTGALHVTHSDGKILALHAPNRWDSAEVHKAKDTAISPLVGVSIDEIVNARIRDREYRDSAFA